MHLGMARVGQPQNRGRALLVAIACMAVLNACGSTSSDTGPSSSGSSGSTNPPPEPGVCQGCTPPLVYSGGPVMGAAGVTITPIYWAPSGNDMAQGYVSGVNQYLNDIAAASGQSDNTYAISTEYSQQSNGSTAKIQYKIQVGQAIMDSTAFPATDSSCPIAAPATACVTKAQMIAELSSQLSANNLPTDFSHFYLLFLPPNVSSSDGMTTTGFCGYHDGYAVPNNGGTLLWADEPFPTADCFSGQSPTGNPAVDAEVSTLSHEIIEAETDPLVGSNPGWTDSSKSEIGDECSWSFGPALGSTDPNNAQSTMYNQVINGHQYYTQQIFSNASYQAQGQGHGCILGAYSGAASAPMAVTTAYRLTADAQAASALVDLSTTKIAADGSSTAKVTMTAVDAAGEPASGNRVHFDVAPVDETKGACGAVAPTDGNTDANGEVTTTYTASTANAACIIIAIDSKTGASDWATVYQGGASNDEPVITDASVPASLAPGASDTFTMTANNPSSEVIKDARFDVFLTGDENGATGLTADQVHITYSDTATGGSMVPLSLSGETLNGGEIEGDAKPDSSADVPAGATDTVTFHITLDSSAPTTASTGSPLHLEIDLDQFDPADSSTNNLDYIGPADISIG